MIRAPVATLEAGESTLAGATFHYLTRVLRLRAGDAFVAFDPAAVREADAEVLAIERDSMRVRYGAARPAAAAALREVLWIQGLAKGEKNDAIVQDATELGVTRVCFAPSVRSVARLARLEKERTDRRVERWTRIAREASRQSGRGDAPAVEVAETWEQAVRAVPKEVARFCLHPNAPQALSEALLPALRSGGALAFAVGPEGGLGAAEVAAAVDEGWSVCSLGALVLRTETVAAAVLGAVAVWGGGGDAGGRSGSDR